MVVKYDTSWSTTDDPCDYEKTLFDTSMDHATFDILSLTQTAASGESFSVSSTLPD
jgi:hypothetical protein